MRIISGILKGSKLLMVEKKTTRPLKDGAREGIFNLLTHSNKVLFSLEKSNILDLYAGTGSFGLECLSRKAAFAYFIENEKDAFDILKKNIKKLKLEEKTKFFLSHTFEFLTNKINLNLKFDLIFCDPPFENQNVEKLIRVIFDKKWLSKNGVIVLHRNKKTVDKLPNFFKVIDERFYGLSKITFGNLSL